MTPELEQRLFDRYPALFRRRTLSKRETCMCWGVQCHDGWHDLIDAMCAALEPFAGLELEQVKEKFGALRVYTGMADGSHVPDEAHAIVKRAEHLSVFVCPLCGGPGARRVQGRWWIAYRCADCNTKEER